jgi:hypothetical protein
VFCQERCAPCILVRVLSTSSYGHTPHRQPPASRQSENHDVKSHECRLGAGRLSTRADDLVHQTRGWRGHRRADQPRKGKQQATSKPSRNAEQKHTTPTNIRSPQRAPFPARHKLTHSTTCQTTNPNLSPGFRRWRLRLRMGARKSATNSNSSGGNNPTIHVCIALRVLPSC